jgi:hypothetical protein
MTTPGSEQKSCEGHCDISMESPEHDCVFLKTEWYFVITNPLSDSLLLSGE